MKSIGYIGNYYGGLFVTENNGKFYWLIEDYDTNFEDIEEWDEIPKELYEELIKQEVKR